MKSENDFFNILKKYYSSIISKKFKNSFHARTESAKLSEQIFNFKKFDLRGTENLPSTSGNIFIYNHLSNPENYILKDDFQITLDSHFISSIISQNYYKTPGMRVIRYSLPKEIGHNNYYNKFGYIRVYSKDYLPENITQNEIKKSKTNFYKKSKEALINNENLIITPEGISSSTDNSPSEFKAGIFRMAIKSKIDPVFVPIILTNFDKLNSRTIYRCEIKSSFRLSDVIKDINNKKSLDDFIKKFNLKYKKWVTQLKNIGPGYADEIKKIKEKTIKNKSKKDLVVFYGSSTIRLWDNIEDHFNKFNILNFGFGGAFIQDCIKHFENLFQSIEPKVIILYVGGNDLSLGFSENKINKLFKSLLGQIRIKFPNCFIFLISIKPSKHRIDKMNSIKTLNRIMKNELGKTPKSAFINIFDKFIDKKGNIINKYFLIDRLHLSQSGYDIWADEVRKSLNSSL
tara:strand:+ start:2497 stop:3870 length:1374 start_codon:yes stop_codon:yes gene_type:complete